MKERSQRKGCTSLFSYREALTGPLFPWVRVCACRTIRTLLSPWSVSFFLLVFLCFGAREKHSSWITPCLSCSVITIIKQALAQQSSPDSRHWLCCYTCTSHQVLASQLWPPAHSHSPPASTHFQLTVALPYTIFTSERC